MTSNIDRGVGAFCPDCGANVRTELNRCWLCLRRLPPIGEKAFEPPVETPWQPAAASKPGLSPRTPPGGDSQFSLATILLVITLIAICLGVFRISPGLGIIVVAMAMPALFATIVVGAQQRRRGQRLTIAEKIGTFAAAVGVILLAAVASIAALLVTCLGTLSLAQGNWAVGILVVAALGAVGGLIVAAFQTLARVLRPPSA